MSRPDGAARFDLFLARNFLGGRECAEIAAEMRAGRGERAAVYGLGPAGGVDERVRKVARHELARETAESVRRKLTELKPEVERHFGVRLGDCEEPQFLRYRVGDFFVAHQDGNTGMMRLAQEARRVSVVVFLSRQSDAPEAGAYCGGSLVFHDWRVGRGGGEQFRLAGEPGTLVAFRAETTHEVTPVTHGERLSIACWYS